MTSEMNSTSTTTSRTGRTGRTGLAKALTVLGLSVAVFLLGMAGSATAAKLVTGKDVKNGSLTGLDVKKGSLGEAKLATGVKKKLNASALPGYEVVSQTQEVSTASADTVFVACTPGKVAIGGGGSFETTEFAATIQESAPAKQIGDLFGPAEADAADAWRVTGSHNGLDPVDLTAWVICVTA